MLTVLCVQLRFQASQLLWWESSPTKDGTTWTTSLSGAFRRLLSRERSSHLSRWVLPKPGPGEKRVNRWNTFPQTVSFGLFCCKQRRRDFLQLMLDARTSEESVSLEHFDAAHPAGELDNTQDQNQDEQVRQQERPQRKVITEDEIVGQAFVFLVAGYETSSNTLGFACYLLAINPECQRELQREVDHFFSRHVSEAFPRKCMLE